MTQSMTKKTVPKLDPLAPSRDVLLSLADVADITGNVICPSGHTPEMEALKKALYSQGVADWLVAIGRYRRHATTTVQLGEMP